jgi:hypothetical protein
MLVKMQFETVVEHCSFQHGNIRGFTSGIDAFQTMFKRLELYLTK